MSMTITSLPERSSSALRKAIADADASGQEVLFLGDDSFRLDVNPGALERMRRALHDSGGGIVYSDGVGRPRIDYQPGSVRDDFDFGPLIGISVPRAQAAFEAHGMPDGLRWGALYDLRLKLSLDTPIVRVAEPLYDAADPDARSSSEKLFDYVDPSSREYQLEMERIVTAHLVRAGAFLPPREGRVRGVEDGFRLKATVVIPVRNRGRTIVDAVASALGQTATFDFNVLVVDNHSTDDTAAVLGAVSDPRLLFGSLNAGTSVSEAAGRKRLPHPSAAGLPCNWIPTICFQIRGSSPVSSAKWKRAVTRCSWGRIRLSISTSGRFSPAWSTTANGPPRTATTMPSG